MPLVFLQKIKSTVNFNTRIKNKRYDRLPVTDNNHISGIYVFSCKDLNPYQPLFNDGQPSLIFMPRKSDTVFLHGQNAMKQFSSVWVCCGVIENTYWEMAREVEYILVVRFKPASFYSIFNIQPTTFDKKPIQCMYNLVDKQWKNVFDKMYEKPTATERAAFLSNTIAMSPVDENFPHILYDAMEYIDQRKGNTSVTEVLQHIGKRVNSKWLYRNFMRFIGISPKKYISLQRFIFASTYYQDPSTSKQSGVPVRWGYYDNNHFFKDFKKYLGATPSKLSV